VNTRQSALVSDDGKPITARDLKALERMTIASAKSRLSNEATVEDAGRVIGIYIECLNRLGLTPETAGELQQVLSEKEARVYSDAENIIKVAVGLEGLPLSYESEKRLRFECELLCNGTKLLGDDVYDQTLEGVKNSL
jgi:replicative DNA helicase Mcm